MKFNKEAILGSMLGGLTCISIYILCFAFMVKIVFELITKDQPKWTMSKKYQVVPDMINLKNESLFYALYL